MKTTSKEKSQVEKFRELAREIETVDSEEPLNAAIRKVAKAPPPKDDKQADTKK
ncbi:DNA-binding protein [Mesorhizobium sp.]|uniref:DNA-binding protein n=1 Tax=Mesorhizobium sp. TaxID=1871066 RepID=UPI0025C2A513|nr:DNA-binding protein [Mesorhizobium sp.]